MSWKTLPIWIKWGIYLFILAWIQTIIVALTWIPWFAIPFGIFLGFSSKVIFHFFDFVGFIVGAPDYNYGGLISSLAGLMNSLFFFVFGSIIGWIREKLRYKKNIEILKNQKISALDKIIVTFFKIFLVLIIILLLTVGIIGNAHFSKKNKLIASELSQLREITKNLESFDDMNDKIDYCNSLTGIYSLPSPYKSNDGENRTLYFKDDCIHELIYNYDYTTTLSPEKAREYCREMESDSSVKTCLIKVDKDRISLNLETLTLKTEILSYCDNQNDDSLFEYCLYSIFDPYYKGVELKVSFDNNEILEYCSNLKSLERKKECSKYASRN